MEPTGHYWKAFANFLLKQAKITVVLINSYHTKRAKELDDNSQTKSDKKDALTIVRLDKDGRYFETDLPHDVYADLRGLTTTRYSMNKRKKSIINTITTVLDEYFPEVEKVFKHPFKGKKFAEKDAGTGSYKQEGAYSYIYTVQKESLL